MSYLGSVGEAKLQALGISSEDLKAWQRVVGTPDDGDPGPRTFAATVEWLRAHGFIAPPALPLEARSRVVAIARGELGEQDPDKYWRVVCPALMGHPHDVSWCGGFALWCLHAAGLTQQPWKQGLGFAEVIPLRKVQLPEPGDIAVYARNWHHAIVERCANGRVYTIDGNSMPSPREGVVAHDGIGGNPAPRPITDAFAYYSIASLVA